MYAAASFVTFSSRMSPVIPTGWAAPTLVPGAIAANGHEIRMKAPAEAARAPGGPTQQSTGTVGLLDRQDDPAHRRVESARGIQPHDDGGGSVVPGGLDRALEVLGGQRVDGSGLLEEPRTAPPGDGVERWRRRPRACGMARNKAPAARAVHPNRRDIVIPVPSSVRRRARPAPIYPVVPSDCAQAPADPSPRPRPRDPDLRPPDGAVDPRRSDPPPRRDHPRREPPVGEGDGLHGHRRGTPPRRREDRRAPRLVRRAGHPDRDAVAAVHREPFPRRARGRRSARDHRGQGADARVGQRLEDPRARVRRICFPRRPAMFCNRPRKSRPATPSAS